jgi:hypothetical protein
VVRLILPPLAIFIFVTLVFYTFVLTSQTSGVGFEGSSFPWVAFAATCVAMLIGIFFGSLYRALGDRQGEISIGNEVVKVVRSSSFWRALCVSPLVFLAIYTISKGLPGDIPSLLLAFQNGFFWESVLKREAPRAQPAATPTNDPGHA